MQVAQSRSLILIGVLALGSCLTAFMSAPTVAAARWPTAHSFYAVDGWAVSAPRADIQQSDGKLTRFERVYRHRDGTTVNAILTTSPEAKQIYRSGADLRLLGGGYVVNPAPEDLVPSGQGRMGLVADGHGGRWLMIYAFGERRGTLGNGVPAWAMVALDMLLAKPNDYYLAQFLVGGDRLEEPSVHQTVVLADTILQRLTEWYSDSNVGELLNSL